MSNEQSKAAARRVLDPRFAERWFVGVGLDVGCGLDPINRDLFPNCTAIVPYDRCYGAIDAQTLEDCVDGDFDFIHSSHLLEHLPAPGSALRRWLEVLRPGGFIVCTVPDEVLYEHGIWPTWNNPDHKHCFSLRSPSAIPEAIHLPTLLSRLPAELELLQLLTQHYDPADQSDQTLGSAECAIEFILRKP